MSGESVEYPSGMARVSSNCRHLTRFIPNLKDGRVEPQDRRQGPSQYVFAPKNRKSKGAVSSRARIISTGAKGGDFWGCWASGRGQDYDRCQVMRAAELTPTSGNATSRDTTCFLSRNPDATTNWLFPAVGGHGSASPAGRRTLLVAAEL